MASNNISYIEPNELEEILNKGLVQSKLKIIDVRDDDFNGGHIKGAINCPVGKFDNDQSIDEIIGNASSVETVVFHCFKSQQRGPFCAKQFSKRLDELAKSNPNTPPLQV